MVTICCVPHVDRPSSANGPRPESTAKHPLPSAGTIDALWELFPARRTAPDEAGGVLRAGAASL